MSYRTAKEIAAALRVTKRAVQRRAVNERWSHVLIQDRGGLIPIFICRKLPSDVREPLGITDE